jgi:hypothetical protein
LLQKLTFVAFKTSFSLRAFTMRVLFLTFACFAYLSDARRVQKATGETRAADASGAGVSNAGMRVWEKQNLAQYRSGKLNAAELGLANFKRAMQDQSMLSDLVQMSASQEQYSQLAKMMSDPSFQKAAKSLADKMSLREDASSFLQDAQGAYEELKGHFEQMDSSMAAQSLAEVGDSNVQVQTDPQSKTLKALAMLLMALNPASAFVPVAKSSLPASSRPRSTAITQMSTGVSDVDNVGITGPLGFFDPAGLSEDKSEAKIRFFREVELKHGRVAMLAALGFLVGEQFHPLFGGNIDVPSYLAFQQTPLETFWPAVVAAIAIPEIYSVFTFNEPGVDGDQWTMKPDGRRPGDLDFDPLGLKPEDPAELDELQTKEINNGRLAMIGIAGMVAQELVDGQKIF